MGTLGNAPPVLAPASGEIPAFAREIQNEWFDVAPSATRSRAVARAWRQFWQYNALNALASAAEGLGQEIPHLLGAVEAYDVDRSLSPRLSARLATLMEAMSKGNGYGVYDTVQAWCADPPAPVGLRMMRLPDAPTGGAPIGPIRCRHPAPGTSSP